MSVPDTAVCILRSKSAALRNGKKKECFIFFIRREILLLIRLDKTAYGRTQPL